MKEPETNPTKASCSLKEPLFFFIEALHALQVFDTKPPKSCTTRAPNKNLASAPRI